MPDESGGSGLNQARRIGPHCAAPWRSACRSAARRGGSVYRRPRGGQCRTRPPWYHRPRGRRAAPPGSVILRPWSSVPSAAQVICALSGPVGTICGPGPTASAFRFHLRPAPVAPHLRPWLSVPHLRPWSSAPSAASDHRPAPAALDRPNPWPGRASIRDPNRPRLRPRARAHRRPGSSASVIPSTRLFIPSQARHAWLVTTAH